MKIDIMGKTHNGNKTYYVVDVDKKEIIGEFYNPITADELIMQIIKSAKDSLDSDVNELEDQPEFYKTGIKIKRGIEHYKTHYKCMNCQNAGRHYIPKNLALINCHNCGIELPVRPATSKGFPHRDEFGNYFISTNLI